MIPKVLITGSSGFIGRNFIRISQGFKIRESDLLIQKVEEVNFDGIDCVLHLAALVHQMKDASEEQYYHINRDLAYEVAVRAKQQGVKQFIYMSSAKVYGESSSKDSFFDEDSTCMPTDSYGRSKHEAELLIRNLNDDLFKVAIVRSPLVYGIGVKANMLNLVRFANRFPIIPLMAINNSRSIVYVGNLVALLTTIIEKCVSGIFIAGDRKPLSTSDLILLINNALKRKKWLFKMPEFLVNILKFLKPKIYQRLYGSLVLDNSNTMKTLDFYPPFSTEEGIQEMVKWYLESVVSD